jgi:hypothetical protein
MSVDDDIKKMQATLDRYVAEDEARAKNWAARNKGWLIALAVTAMVCFIAGHLLR